jgi:hypothetical protein
VRFIDMHAPAAVPSARRGDAAALAKLSSEERAVCEQLWADVAALLKKAEAAATQGKP